MKKQNKSLTGFQEKVYSEVQKIPKGEVRTYKQIASAIGHPKASRAVGNALNKNPHPQPLRGSFGGQADLKTIPCHRVVRSDGTVGGYRYGTKKKKTLLKGEGVFSS